MKAVGIILLEGYGTPVGLLSRRYTHNAFSSVCRQDQSAARTSALPPVTPTQESNNLDFRCL